MEMTSLGEAIKEQILANLAVWLEQQKLIDSFT